MEITTTEARASRKGGRMAFTNFNETEITSANLDDFIEALRSFGTKRGFAAANAWAKKLNPWFEQHTSREMAFTSREYSPRIARQAVSFEFDDQRMPTECPDGCGGVAWYRATVGCNICTSCHALDHHGPNGCLSDLLDLR